MTSIFYNFQIMFLSYCHYFVHFTWKTCHVNNKNSFCLICNFFFYFFWIDINMFWSNNIAEYRSSACIANTVGRCSKSKRRTYNLITRTNTRNQTAKMQRISTIGCTYSVVNMKHVNKHFF